MAGVAPNTHRTRTTKTAYKLSHITSHPRGTVVFLHRRKNATCSGMSPNGTYYMNSTDTRYKAFFDANNNGWLDYGDKMFTSRLSCQRCPPGSRRQPVGVGLSFCIRSVTSSDIALFHMVIGPEFAKAKAMRRKISAGKFQGHRKVGGTAAQVGFGGVLKAFGLYNDLMRADAIVTQGQKTYGFLDL